MSNQQRSPQLAMCRPNLDNLPPIEPPAGYRVRAYRPGDAADWAAVISEAFERTLAPDHFEKKMQGDAAFRPERVLFVEGPEGVVGTASAWEVPAWGRETGVLHMVGVRPACAGRRLGYWVSLAGLHQMAREERRAAVLRTDDTRLAAIRTYLRMGFEPLLVDENQRERWPAVFRALGEEGWAERYCALLAGPIWQPQASHS